MHPVQQQIQYKYSIQGKTYRWYTKTVPPKHFHTLNSTKVTLQVIKNRYKVNYDVQEVHIYDKV